MQDTNAETAKTHETPAASQDIGAWLKRPLTVTAPTWAFGVAGLAALALLALRSTRPGPMRGKLSQT